MTLKKMAGRLHAFSRPISTQPLQIEIVVVKLLILLKQNCINLHNIASRLLYHHALLQERNNKDVIVITLSSLSTQLKTDLKGRFFDTTVRNKIKLLIVSTARQKLYLTVRFVLDVILIFINTFEVTFKISHFCPQVSSTVSFTPEH